MSSISADIRMNDSRLRCLKITINHSNNISTCYRWNNHHIIVYLECLKYFFRPIQTSTHTIHVSAQPIQHVYNCIYKPVTLSGWVTLYEPLENIIWSGFRITEALLPRRGLVAKGAFVLDILTIISLLFSFFRLQLKNKYVYYI